MDQWTTTIEGEAAKRAARVISTGIRAVRILPSLTVALWCKTLCHDTCQSSSKTQIHWWSHLSLNSKCLSCLVGHQGSTHLGCSSHLLGLAALIQWPKFNQWIKTRQKKSRMIKRVNMEKYWSSAINRSLTKMWTEFNPSRTISSVTSQNLTSRLIHRMLL